MASCTGADAQYTDQAACLQMCNTAAGWKLGAVGDTSGNTVGCRSYHAGAAAGNPGVHCPHAGPSGGGVCGSYCESYCELAVQNCTGNDAVYADMDACMGACALFPADGTPNTTTGNSVQCRIYHAGAPAAASPATHCPHTSASGGNLCGTWCDVYCELALDNCTGANQLYADANACATACAAFPTTGAPGATSGNTVQCRIYHAGVPAKTSPGTHCPHAGVSGGGVCQ